ncbi:MAG TPA: D-alanyl-D-alanine carboxypeptidase, partial [Frankiaceae bacterium]|nr:D-alanyl-D-alanine carboxypeptidase [Frankiaceae bacterium]
ARDTVVRDPTGLDAPGGVTSAYDLALIARAALGRPDVRRYATVRRATVRAPGKGSFEIQNHNPLLASYPGCIGVKNGYTEHARATYVGAARRGGHTLVVVLLRAEPRYAAQARALLDWGFAARGGTAPVGRLVEPDAAAATAASPSPPGARPPAAAVTARRRSGGWLLPAGIGLAAVAAAGVGWLALRLRRRPGPLPAPEP